MHSNYNRQMCELVGEAATVTSPLGLRNLVHYMYTAGSFEVPTDASLLNDSVDYPQVPRPEEDELIAAQQVQELIDEESDELDDITDSVE